MLKLFNASLLILLLSTLVLADSLYGTVTYKNKNKSTEQKNTDKKTLIINTSWDYGRTAQIDEKGNYKIDFQTKVGEKVSVFVNGNKYTEIEIKGDTKLDIVVNQ